MTEQKSVEEITTDLSKPENQAELSKVLNDGFAAGTNNPAAANPAEAIPAENKVDTETPAEDKGGEPQDKTGDEVNSKKSRVETLLHDRNEAKAEAAEKGTEVQVLSRQVEVLTKALQNLTGNGGEAAVNQGGADDSNANKSVEEAVKDALAKADAERNAIANAEKSINDQIQALDENKETPNAKDYANELKAIMAKHPTLTAYAAYKMLQGEGIITANGTSNRSNANKTSTGNRSKTNLLDTKRPEEMTQEEAFARLKEAEKAGDLNGLI